MIAAALGAGARLSPDGADSSAALTACASSAGAALALALALAFAALDIIRTTLAQMTAAVTNLPMDMLIDDGSIPSLPLRRLRSAQVRFLAPEPVAPSTSSSIALVSSWFWGRGSVRRRTKTDVRRC